MLRMADAAEIRHPADIPEEPDGRPVRGPRPDQIILTQRKDRIDQIVPLKSSVPGRSNSLVIATVSQAYINEDALTDGLFDVARLKVLSRLGYMDYAVVDNTFRLNRPE